MIYSSKEFAYLRPKKSYLQTFNKLKNRAAHTPPQGTAAATRTNTLWSLLNSSLKDYCSTSSLHCFHYFASNKLARFEKVIWLSIIMAMSICCIIVYTGLTELYYSQRIQTTVADSVHPIFIVPFPSVGICPRNRIDWHRLHHKAPKRFLPPDVDNQTINTFYKFFESLSDIKFYTLHRFAPLFDPAANVNLSLIDGVNVLDVLEYLTFSCTQVFEEFCMWRYKSYNCCELFTLERTEMGFCYTFNSMVSPMTQEKAKNNKFYPYHNSYSGEGSGLEVKVLLNENKMKPGDRTINGVYIMIKKNDEWHADVKFVNHNTFSKLPLLAQLTETDKLLRYVSPEKRNCLFDDETQYRFFNKIPGLGYWRGNCRTRCHQEYVLKYCKCNLNPLFPDRESVRFSCFFYFYYTLAVLHGCLCVNERINAALDNFTSCKPSDFKCIYKHAKIFSRETQLFESKYIHDVDNESMICNCLNSCRQLWYTAFYSSFPLEDLNDTTGIKTIHLDIHYQSPFILKYRTAMRYTIVELIANFGGIMGLFLGASLLSAIELIYFFTFGFYIRFYKQNQKQYRPKSTRSQVKPKLVKLSFINPYQNY